jgi:hypothetical protein
MVIGFRAELGRARRSQAREVVEAGGGGPKEHNAGGDARGHGERGA